MRKIVVRMVRAEWAMLSILLMVLFMATRVGMAKADTISINYQGETSLGVYSYPVDNNGNFAPGYLYIPMENDEQISIFAQDGATLHVFDDAIGTNELAVPASLNTNGQAQQVANGSYYNTGIVHLTQGWHKLYVTHTVLTLSADETGNFCRVNFSTGVLHSQIETVTPTISIGDWQGAGPWTSVITLQMLGSDGVTPAAGDNVTIAIAKVTSDPEGQNVVNIPGPTWDSSTQVLDANGSMTATLTWGNNCTSPTIQYYVWLTVVDNSQPPSYIPATIVPDAQPAMNVQVARNQRTAMVAQTPVYGFPVSPIPAPAPGGGGGGVTLYPVRCLNIRMLSNTPTTWGHSTVYKLQIIDQNGAGIKCNSVREAFSDITKATAPPQLVAQLKSAPGTPNSTTTDASGYFNDTNATTINFNSGASTFWYTFTQQFYATTTKEYKLNTHTVTHYQSGAIRVQH